MLDLLTAYRLPVGDWPWLQMTPPRPFSGLARNSSGWSPERTFWPLSGLGWGDLIGSTFVYTYSARVRPRIVWLRREWRSFVYLSD